MGLKDKLEKAIKANLKIKIEIYLEYEGYFEIDTNKCNKAMDYIEVYNRELSYKNKPRIIIVLAD